MRRPLAVGLLALMSAASVPAVQAQPAPSTLRIVLREEPDRLDPTLARTFVGRIVFAGLCDKLFDIDDKLQIIPQLATGYEYTDPKTLIIHLRPGVKFHDETPMDAEAVKYSLERHLHMQASARSSEINIMDHVEVVDPLTVRVLLKAPSAPFVAQLTDRAGMIVSPKAAEAEGQDFALHPVCAGPMKFVERVAQDHITLERFADYWNKDAIHFDRVIYLPIPDSSIRLANLQAGSVDLVEYILPTDADTVKHDPKLRLVTYDALGYQGITYNVANGPQAKTPLGQSAAARRAFDMSIDREALMQVVYNGMFSPTAQAVPPESPFFDAALKPVTRDVDGAKALLKQAGLTPPVPVNLLVPNSPDITQMAEIIQSMAADAGFDVKLTTMEFASRRWTWPSRAALRRTCWLGPAGSIRMAICTASCIPTRARRITANTAIQRWTSCWMTPGPREMWPSARRSTRRKRSWSRRICLFPISTRNVTWPGYQPSCTASSRSRTG